MITPGELAELRAMEEAAMLSAGVITRDGGDLEWDPGEGVFEPGAPTTIYDGKCRIMPADARAVAVVNMGEELLAVSSYTLRLPWTVIGVRIGDVWTPTEAEDTGMLTRSFLVRSVTWSDYMTARVLTVQDVERQEPAGGDSS